MLQDFVVYYLGPTAAFLIFFPVILLTVFGFFVYLMSKAHL